MTDQKRSIDSYDALAVSIERVLRSDLEPPGSAEQLAGSIDRLMLAESRAAELRLAMLRLLVVVPLFIVGVWLLIRQGAAGDEGRRAFVAFVSASWLVYAAVLVLALRRGWFRRWVARITLMADAAMILLTMLPAWETGTLPGLSQASTLAYLTALCAFLGISGSLRFSRTDARLGTTLSILVFVIVGALTRAEALSLIAIAMTILAAGLLSASVTTLLRRMVTDEVARATLSSMYKEAEQTLEARQQVLRIVSHDLRNPLGTISMAASLMLDVPMERPQALEHLARIKRAGERMNRLIQDLLEVARMEAGHVAIDVRTQDIAPMMYEAHEMLLPLATEKRIGLEMRVAENLPTVQADSGRVLQVLSNLVGNAIKFTPTDGRIVMSAERYADTVQFSVSDTGLGMAPEQLSQIFGQFWQANPADRRGVGLGLSIAKAIVEAHGGRIWVESRVGEGSTFFFTLESATAAQG